MGERAGKAGTRVASYEKKLNVAERKDRRVTRQFFLTRTIPATTTECVWDGNGRGTGSWPGKGRRGIYCLSQERGGGVYKIIVLVMEGEEGYILS